MRAITLENIKFYEYREGGVPEYQLLDPQLEQAEFYQLDAQRRYQLARLPQELTPSDAR